MSRGRYGSIAALVAYVVVGLGCGPAPCPVRNAPPPASASVAPPASQSADPLGPRPTADPPKAIHIPAPAIFQTANGLTVWLLERHTLPLVSVTFAVSAGSASDPPDRPGLAHITADMLDEGAGSMNAIQLSTAINDLGTSISIGTGQDSSAVSLTVLKAHFSKAFGILGDVVARPRFEQKDWKRVSGLWINGLEQRPDDPEEVSRVVVRAALYGARTPYGHPSDGFVADAKKVRLSDVKTFHKSHWRPDRAALIVVGDVTRAELDAAIASSLSTWKAPAKPAPELAPVSALVPLEKRPKVIVVDRPDAPQSVVAVVRDGVSASDPRAPVLDLVNTALGGSFTSRLNQNLREDKHWTYGAFSGFSHPRGQGSFVARAAVFVEVTGKALKEILEELQKMADQGPTQEEFAKVKAQDRSDLIQTYETVGDTGSRLATLYTLGLDPGFDVAASAARQSANLTQAAELAKARIDPATATIVVVGPRDKVVPQLVEAGLTQVEYWGPDGAVVAGK